MKSITKFTLAFAICAAGIASLGGCKSSSTGPDGTDPLTKPGTGTTYTSATYDTDSTGTKVPGSDSVTVTTVKATGMTVGGKSDVTFFLSDKGDSTYIRYESNGDVSMWYGNSLDPTGSHAWITIPFVSKTAQTTKLIDTLVVDSTIGPTSVKMSVTASGSGTENITVGAGTFNAFKGQMVLTATLPTFGGIVTFITATQTVWFAPKIGYIVKDQTVAVASAPSIQLSITNGNVGTLTSYSLK